MSLPLRTSAIAARLCWLVLPMLALLLGAPRLLAQGQAPPVERISLVAPQSVQQNSITRQALADAKQLLAKGFSVAAVQIGDAPAAGADLVLRLRAVPEGREAQPSRFEKQTDADISHYPDHGYRWEETSRSPVTLKLKSPSHFGLATGLYALLQRQLGYAFYHPKETLIPELERWPLPRSFTFEGTPRYDKKGINPHTQHPIEVTEQLLDPQAYGGIEDVKAHIDWLARNGMNLYQFLVLRKIDGLEEWVQYAKQYVDYAHSRGIRVMLDISLHSLQQYHYQLIHYWPRDWRSPRKQLKAQFETLFQVDWDFIKLNTGKGEFVGGPRRGHWNQIKYYAYTLIQEEYDTPVLDAKHVIKHHNYEQPVGQREQSAEKLKRKAKKKRTVKGKQGQTLEMPQRGVLVHSVMCYSLTDTLAPVYENKNLRHMLHYMDKQVKKDRVTWYWPETAYWISFDNTVPMFLMPYLRARWQDIYTARQHGATSHSIFTSGWEWGYWLVEWSVMQWSYSYTMNGDSVPDSPISAFTQLFPQVPIQHWFRQNLALQDSTLIADTLLAYMCPAQPTDEMPKFLIDNEFQPRPDWDWQWLANKAPESKLQAVENGPLERLEYYGKEQLARADSLQAAFAAAGYGPQSSDSLRAKLAHEFVLGLKVTGLRALHRLRTISGIIAHRRKQIASCGDKKPYKTEKATQLAAARQLRKRAQKLVNQQEQHYRFRHKLLAERRYSHTAYHFGYLYPVDNLHFWRREEAQVKKNNWSFLHMNIWNFARIAGLF